MNTDTAEIILVAKPWKGGLADYVYMALEQLFPGKTTWLPTRPTTLAGQLSYRRDRRGWEQGIIEQVAGSKAGAVIFINDLPVFRELPFSERYRLWLTDGPQPARETLAPYGRVFLTDDGYAGNILDVLPASRYGGELGFACCSQVHRPVSPASTQRDICFVGNRDKKRDRFIDSLIASELSATVAGNYFVNTRQFWKQPTAFRPAVHFSRMSSIYARHRLSLNLHAEVIRRGTNMRTFEAAAYGVPQLVEQQDGMERYFEPGREIETFSEPAEMLDKSRELLADPDRRKTMARAAQERVMAEHTYEHRVKKLLEGLL